VILCSKANCRTIHNFYFLRRRQHTKSLRDCSTDVCSSDLAARAAEIGAAGGISNARALAGLYAPLANGGSLKGVGLVSRDTLAQIGRASCSVVMNIICYTVYTTNDNLMRTY